MRATGRGSTVISAVAVSGRPPPAGRTTAVATMVPVAPAVTSPVESTDPSNAPPDWNHWTTPPATGAPAPLTTLARSRRVSPMAIDALPGSTTNRLVAAGCWRRTRTSKLKPDMESPELNDVRCFRGARNGGPGSGQIIDGGGAAPRPY